MRVSKLILLLVLLTSTSAMARNVWRECGIGGMIFQKTGWAAITSNITWDLGTTATTSNISSEDLCEGRSASIAKFIYKTYANVQEQTVIGQGKHLTAMLTIAGCEEKYHGQIIKSLRVNLAKTIKTNNIYMDKVKDYHTNLVESISRNFSNKCNLI